MNPPSFDLSGRVALVTGGGSGLGRAIADGLAGAGARVVIVGRNADKLAAAVSDMTGQGASAASAVCDLTDREAVARLGPEVEAQHGPIDILVNNAGIQRRMPALDFTAGDWDLMLATHLSAPFFLVRSVAPGMLARRRGKIVNTLSLMSELARPSVAPYTAAKGGLKMLTKAFAVEFGPHNVQVNGLAPGYFATELTRPLVEDPEFDGWLRARTPLRRWGRPEDLAGAAVFLASSASDFVTGQVLFVDGGMTASV